MKKSFYLLTILALLLQYGLVSLPGASAREAVEEPQAPAEVILYVKPVATGTGNCDSWANACELQTALSAAISGDEIWVQAGIYKPTTGTDRTSTFSMKSGVALYGCFAGTETSRDQRDWETNVTNLRVCLGSTRRFTLDRYAGRSLRSAGCICHQGKYSTAMTLSRNGTRSGECAVPLLWFA